MSGMFEWFIGSRYRLRSHTRTRLPPHLNNFHIVIMRKDKKKSLRNLLEHVLNDVGMSHTSAARFLWVKLWN